MQRSGVDIKKSFGTDSFELSILETVESTTVSQRFAEPVFYNLLSGKKIMKFGQDEKSVEYLPGNIMIVPPQLNMEVCFPDSNLTNPTKCLSLVIDPARIAASLSLLNDRFPRIDGKPWQLFINHYSMFANEEISKLMLKLYKLAKEFSEESKIIADLTLAELIVLICQTQNLNAYETDNVHLIGGNNTLQNLIGYIQNNLDSNLSVQTLSQEAAMSKTTLFRTFKREFNISPVDYINRIRINKAKQLIDNNPHLNIAEICYSVGFGNPNYFTKVFKKQFGNTPSVYKKKYS